jgi:hypothetical protein
LRTPIFTLAAWGKRANANTTSGGGYPSHFFCSCHKVYAFGAEPDGRLFLGHPYKELERKTVPGRIADLQFHHVALFKTEKKATFFLDGEPCSEMDFDEPFEYDGPLAIFSVGNNQGFPFLAHDFQPPFGGRRGQATGQFDPVN